DALLLAAGELLREVVPPVRHADAAERGLGPLPALGGGEREVEQRELDVLVDRQLVDQVEALEDEAERAPPEVGPAALVVARDVGAVEDEPPAAGLVEQAEDVEQRGLAAAARPHDGDELAGPGLERDVVERGRLHLVGGIDLTEAFGLDERDALGDVYVGHG